MLGLFCFFITFNGAGSKKLKEDVGRTITQPRKSRRPLPAAKMKWLDDLSLYVPIGLTENLIQDTRPDKARPVPYHGRTGHRLTSVSNPLQGELDLLSQYC